jgi:hypothetical protein
MALRKKASKKSGKRSPMRRMKKAIHRGESLL